MTCYSVDQLQNILANNVFNYTKDPKKAAGRALGTMVEIITFYLLKSWGLGQSLSIERSLAEYGNPDITHNVEYSLHPILQQCEVFFSEKLPITSTKILSSIDKNVFSITRFEKSNNSLLTSDLILRNSCLIASSKELYSSHLVANLDFISNDEYKIIISQQYEKPYAIFECKRVGIEEGIKKGPQSIEKAKQGAYVARMLSSLQKVRMPSGELYGLIYKFNNEICIKPYAELMTEIMESENPSLLCDFILTVGVVSNHGNWFTSDNHNKELKVLAQSYDWLIFLTDKGLYEFINHILLDSESNFEPVKKAFLESYNTKRKRTRFTKVQIDYKADQTLQSYFNDNLIGVENWFNVISPKDKSMQELKSQIFRLKDKNWKEIHSL